MKHVVKTKFTIGKFDAYDSANIIVNGKAIGWLEREWDEEFVSASSRQRKKFISGYAVNIDDDESYPLSFKTKDKARDYIAAWLAAHSGG